MGNRWGVSIAAVLIVGITAGGFAFAPFKDSGVSCGSPLTEAAHGERAFRDNPGNGTSRLVVVTPGEQTLLTAGRIGISGIRMPPTQLTVVCRQPARGRLLGSTVLIGAAVLAIAFMKKRSAAPSERTSEPVPA
jgi:hypothetical protein